MINSKRLRFLLSVKEHTHTVYFTSETRQTHTEMRSRKAGGVAEWSAITSEQQEKTHFPRHVPIPLKAQSQGEHSWETGSSKTGMPSLSFVFGIDHSGDSTFVNGIFTLETRR